MLTGGSGAQHFLGVLCELCGKIFSSIRLPRIVSLGESTVLRRNYIERCVATGLESVVKSFYASEMFFVFSSYFLRLSVFA
ncbi:hypothetical protein Mal52_25650 [Symmachiella dynata]|uniref:Uncharacterized protein n=1 Tax=Symmachiella dynata TaxID=2527995 RepID=A0A517ZNM5_9PLAN|nr:hypothetical protein Mal52_25650 [Symmachiella dynata]